MLCAIALLLSLTFADAFNISDYTISWHNDSIECGGTLSGTVEPGSILLAFLEFTIETDEPQNVIVTTDGAAFWPSCSLLPDELEVNATVYNDTNQMTFTLTGLVPDTSYQLLMAALHPSNASDDESWTIEMLCTTASPSTSPTTPIPTQSPSPAPTMSPTDLPDCSGTEYCC